MTDADTLTRAAELIERLLYSGRDEIYDASDADDTCARLREMAACDVHTDNSAVIAHAQDRIAELEPLQEVAAQLEDEKRALEQRCERLLKLLQLWMDPWNSAETFTKMKNDTAEALKETGNDR